MRARSLTQSQSGFLVESKKDGKKGRTYHFGQLIKGKVVVYFEIKPGEYSGRGVLCNPENLEIIGFID